MVDSVAKSCSQPYIDSKKTTIYIIKNIVSAQTTRSDHA